MGVSTYLLATLCLVFASHRCHAQSAWRTIDSAYTHATGDSNYNYLSLFSGDRYMTLRSRKMENLFSRSVLAGLDISFIPNDFELQASVTTLNNGSLAIHYGKQFGYFALSMSNMLPKKFKYGKKRTFVQNGGPDAAARRSGKIYLFKGCMMAERKKWYSWGKPENISVTMGLPCDVDAAWIENDDVMAILKGPQLWRWEADGSTSGPVPMVDNYELGDWDGPVYQF